MTDTIAAAISALHESISKMGKIADSLHTTQRTLADSANDMDAVWEGKARDKYSSETALLNQKIDRFAAVIDERTVQLRDAVSVYEKVEEGVRAKVTDLSADGVF